MTITDLDSNKDPDTGGRFEFVVELVQLQFANVATTSNNFKSTAIKSIASPKDKAGIVNKKQSIAASGLDAAKNGFNAVIRALSPTEEVRNTSNLPGFGL